jgi:hypothetical protein
LQQGGTTADGLKKLFSHVQDFDHQLEISLHDASDMYKDRCIPQWLMEPFTRKSLV